jgi:hypothetical protein
VIESVILGLGYRAKSGKDAAAQAIIEERDIMHSRAFHNINERQFYDIRRYAFADDLKKEINEMAQDSGGMQRLFLLLRETMGLPRWVQYDLDAPMDDPMSPLGKQRTLLQWWGGEYRRGQDKEYWIKKLIKKLEEDKPQIALVTDLRYLNEFRLCEEYGETIKIVRPGSGAGGHASETELDCLADTDWSAVLYNDGTLEEFQAKAVQVFDDLLLNFP